VAQAPDNPSLYQINTRVWLQERGRALGRRATLDDADDHFLDGVAALGFDWVWWLGVWQTGAAGLAVSRREPAWREDFKTVLSDLSDADITGSPFAVQAYEVHRDFGGRTALARLRARMQRRGLRLLLDFVPNHTAPDHRWVDEHPEYYIPGSAEDLAREPQNYIQIRTERANRILAYGRDPYFAGWPDTLQLNYRAAACRTAMAEQLATIAAQCDGVRCDMAMLLLPDVIQRTWGERAVPCDGTAPVDAPFWPEAIASTRKVHSDFVFMAEVYWDREWDLQQQGFDYTYDKSMYDRVHSQDADRVRRQLWADPSFQHRSVRFLENHDEPRAAAVFPAEVHRAAAAVSFFVPGMRFFHEGQLEGRRSRVPMHLGRRPDEAPDAALAALYARVLDCLKLPALRNGRFRLLECASAWPGNPSFERFVGFAWNGVAGERVLVAVNYGPNAGQCYVQIPWSDLAGVACTLHDRLGSVSYVRDGSDLQTRGLYLDMPAWGAHVFELA
jgi:glycosidase